MKVLRGCIRFQLPTSTKINNGGSEQHVALVVAEYLWRRWSVRLLVLVLKFMVYVDVIITPRILPITIIITLAKSTKLAKIQFNCSSIHRDCSGAYTNNHEVTSSFPHVSLTNPSLRDRLHDLDPPLKIQKYRRTRSPVLWKACSDRLDSHARVIGNHGE